MHILIDSREQRKLEFPIKGTVVGTIVEALPVGDYGCQFSDGTRAPLFFERKSLSDLYGTMTGGHDRFKREVLLAQRHGWKLVLLVEVTMAEVYAGMQYTRMSGESCMQKIFTFWLRYGLQPVFCNGREEAAAFIVETYEAVGRCWKQKGQPLRELFGGIQLPLIETNIND